MTAEIPRRVEQKFWVPPNRLPMALALVRRTCRWDAEYPQEQINSLYFDTADLEQHERSVAGEYAKSKVRIRWYGAEHDPHVTSAGAPGVSAKAETAPIWLELKERRGFTSTKQRRSLEVPASGLEADALTSGIVSSAMLAQTMAGFGFFASRPLLPVVVVSYWRWRFAEPRSGFRIALDAHIRSTMVAPGRGMGERGLELAGAVIEVKGPTADMPASLRQISDLGSSWSRFSKYSASLDAHASDLGSISRLWPSGSVHFG